MDEQSYATSMSGSTYVERGHVVQACPIHALFMAHYPFTTALKFYYSVKIKGKPGKV